MELADALAGMSLFHGVPAARLVTVADAARQRRLRRGEFVWVEGDPATTVCFLVTGRLKTARTSSSGEEIVVEMLEGGSHTGLPGALSARTGRATQVQAIDDSVVVTVPGETLLSFLETSPIVLRRVIEELAETAILVLESWADVVFLDVVGRVARKLLEIAAERGRETIDGTVFDLGMSQRTLAGMISASRENTNRALARLSAAGDIRFEAPLVTILDSKRLRSRSDPLR